MLAIHTTRRPKKYAKKGLRVRVSVHRRMQGPTLVKLETYRLLPRRQATQELTLTSSLCRSAKGLLAQYCFLNCAQSIAFANSHP